MIDIDKIDAKTHEFTGEELGELLLASVRQMNQGAFTKTHQISADTVTIQATTARQAVGLSQKEFATLLGVSVRTLQAWEQGRRTPSKGAMTLLKIATKHPQALLSVL